MKRVKVLGVCSMVAALAGCSFLPGMGGAPGAADPSGPPSAATGQPDPSFDHSAAELDAFVDEHTAGFSAYGKPIAGSLESFEPLEFDMKRGKCYRIVIRLDEGASFGEHARRGVAFKYEASGQPAVMGGPGVHGPGAVASGGCPQSDRTVTFDMFANWGSASDKSRLHELGSGAFTAQLYTKDISEEELAKQAEEMERQLAESQRFNEEYRQKEEARRAEREASYNSSSSSTSSPKPSGPAVVSVTIKNECKQTVKLFYGDKPKFGSGTYSSLGSNTLTSKQMQEGDMIWLVDDGQNGLGAVTISSATRRVEILSSCNGIVSR